MNPLSPAGAGRSPESPEMGFAAAASLEAVMKEMVDIGALDLGEKRANDLERKLKASKKARKKVEEDVVGIEDLRQRLHAAENALSDKKNSPSGKPP
ncbi:hypothetical protein QYE76_062862 [Lolium multiflorum]|uniref:Uncharacterized protein n=1 Tax=Lolium multiflorum TaxID=4521 RepID=A0AAD8S6D6_LOLMU|nr:hypothetical protein QYE76_062862 [Lolium multiflorum]